MDTDHAPGVEFVVRPLAPLQDWKDTDENRAHCPQCDQWFKLVKK